MRKWRSGPILCVLLVFSLALPISSAEDLLETIYDESEAQPSEGVPLFAVTLAAVTSRPQELSISQDSFAASSNAARERDREQLTLRSCSGRLSSSLLCIMRC